MYDCDTCHRQFACQDTFDIHTQACQIQRDKSNFACEEESMTEDTEKSVDDEAEIPEDKTEPSTQTSGAQEGLSGNSAVPNLENKGQNENEKLQFKCDWCDRSFTTMKGVKRHSVVHLKRTSSVDSESLDEEENEPLKKKRKVDDNEEEIQSFPDYSHLPKECIFSCQQCHFRTEVMLEMITHHESLHVTYE